MGAAPTPRPLVTPERLDGLPDVADRLRESARFLTYAESRVHAGRAARSRVVREAHAAGWPRKDIARAVGLTDDAVKAILRATRTTRE